MKLQRERVTECPVCQRIGLAYDARSSWCHDCTERLLVEQERELGDCRQDRQVVEQLVVVSDGSDRL